MITNKDVFYIFKQVRAEVLNKRFQFPKSWEVWFNKQKPSNQKILNQLSLKLNTQWIDIDIQNYFFAGFHILKTFNINNFLDKRVIEKYKELDRHIKRNTEIDITDLNNFVEQIKPLTMVEYCIKYNSQGISFPIQDYLKNKINNAFLGYLVMKRYLFLTNFEKGLLPYLDIKEMVYQLRIQKINLKE